MALIDAGIPLRDYVTACTASLVEEKPLVDISSLESTQGGPELTVVSKCKCGIHYRVNTKIPHFQTKYF